MLLSIFNGLLMLTVVCWENTRFRLLASDEQRGKLPGKRGYSRADTLPLSPHLPRSSAWEVEKADASSQRKEVAFGVQV